MVLYVLISEPFASCNSVVELKEDVDCFCYLQAAMGLLLKYHWVLKDHNGQLFAKGFLGEEDLIPDGNP